MSPSEGAKNAADFHHPSGFRVNLPDGWQATRTEKGHFIFASPNPLKYAFVQPFLGRSAGCAATLRQALSVGVASDIRISTAGKGLALANFSMQNGQARGSILCAETSPSSGMFYGLSAPRADFDRDLPALVSLLKSFAFEAKPARGAATSLPIPPLQTWQEPNEAAHTIQIPQGWRPYGGFTRQGILIGYRSGVQLVSPDGNSLIRLGDQHVRDCMIPGPSARSLPGIQQQYADGTFCPDQSGVQFGERYLQILARDLGLTNVTITNRGDRRDLAQLARTGLAATQLNVRTLFGEIEFPPHAPRSTRRRRSRSLRWPRKGDVFRLPEVVVAAVMFGGFVFLRAGAMAGRRAGTSQG